jgi:hypothetical protein
MLISIEEIGENQLQPGQESMGDFPVLSHCRLVVNLDRNRPVCWSIVKEEPTAFSPFFGTFPSDRIPKATKDISVHFFIRGFTISVNYTSEFRECLEAAAY